MNTVLSNTRNANLYIITALAITLIVFLTLAVVPSITVPQPAIRSEASSQNAYVEFLSGEKVMYGSPARLSEALSTYHIGEKAVYASGADSSSALSMWSFGEKAIYANSVDLGNGLSVWSSGEKAIVRSDALESALTAWRQGEKDAK